MDRHFELGASFEQIESLIVEWAELVESTGMKEIRHKLMEEILELLTSSEAVWDQLVEEVLETERAPHTGGQSQGPNNCLGQCNKVVQATLTMARRL